MTKTAAGGRRAPFPGREQIIEYIRSSPGRVGKRELARAFRLDAEQKEELRRMLKELEVEGAIGRHRGRRYRQPGALPTVAVLEILDVDIDGELSARPAVWTEATPPPKILMAPDKRSRAALVRGDRVLARIRRLGPDAYEGRAIRRLGAGPVRTLGIYRIVGGKGRIQPVDRRNREELVIAPEDACGAEAGELVWADVFQRGPLGLRHARIVERWGPALGPRSISLITIQDHDIPVRFPQEAVDLAETCGPASPEGRVDLRSVALVTIDGEDARDFDDAVWAEADTDPGNPGGWHLLVAIADVAWYVRPGEALDRAALERGNSVYFPDRVVPMLPEALSNGWCSLTPGEDRPCLAAHLWIDADGNPRRHRFVRGLMRSAARLTYRRVQAAFDGLRGSDIEPSLVEGVIRPLYGAYAALARARLRRGVLELDLPERRVVISPASGGIERVELRERLDSHRLIEEFMICANVAAAEALEGVHRPCMYRVHDRPPPDKLDSLREFLAALSLRLPRGQAVRAADFNRILAKTADRPEARLVNEVVLRSQAQAAYDPVNIGHFGLALHRYCHFTSPIRRYADLTVHRSLIDGLKLGEGGVDSHGVDFAQVASHISATERRAAAAERDALDRFTASYLADHVGSVFEGRINGVTRFGLFVTLTDSGADGLIPVSTLPDDFYVHDEKTHRLVGRRGNLEFRLGDALEVRLMEANPITGGMVFQLAGSSAPLKRQARSVSRSEAQRRVAGRQRS